MTKILNKTFAAFMVAASMIAFVGCSDKESDKLDDEDLAAINTQFVDNTVNPTYTKLAAYTEELVELLEEAKANPSQSAVDAACEKFLSAREWWEKSEAFLFGAAGDFGIDPHIDSWPLDMDAYNNIMNSQSMLDALDGEDGDEVAYNTLSNANLGFHGIEYILFREGNNRTYSDITNNEWIYAVAVAGDLRNNCYRLEVGWIGDKAPKSHIEKLDDLEWGYTVAGGENSYGDNIKKAGNAGSTYTSRTAAAIAIVQGMADIADEVGSSKINSAFSAEDVTYIESPYSQKSIIDFHNNIVSIQNSYMGGVEGSRDEKKSLHNYIKSLDASLDAKVIAAINTAIEKIDNMPAPFVNNYSDPKNGEAVEACGELSDVLSEVIEALQKK